MVAGSTVTTPRGNPTPEIVLTMDRKEEENQGFVIKCPAFVTVVAYNVVTPVVSKASTRKWCSRLTLTATSRVLPTKGHPLRWAVWGRMESKITRSLYLNANRVKAIAIVVPTKAIQFVSSAPISIFVSGCWKKVEKEEKKGERGSKQKRDKCFRTLFKLRHCASKGHMLSKICKCLLLKKGTARPPPMKNAFLSGHGISHARDSKPSFEFHSKVCVLLFDRCKRRWAFLE